MQTATLDVILNENLFEYKKSRDSTSSIEFTFLFY